MQIKLNNGLTVDINPDTDLYYDGLWEEKRIKTCLQHINSRSRKFITPFVYAFIFKEFYAIIIDNGNGFVREFHSTREKCQKRIRHYRYLRQKTKN